MQVRSSSRGVHVIHHGFVFCFQEIIGVLRKQVLASDRIAYFGTHRRPLHIQILRPRVPVRLYSMCVLDYKTSID
jgi:hypothetical protein